MKIKYSKFLQQINEEEKRKRNNSIIRSSFTPTKERVSVLDTLYYDQQDIDKKFKHKRMIRIEKEKLELKECTFSPNTHSSKKCLTDRSMTRLTDWSQNRDAKIAQLRMKGSEAHLSSFSPSINKKSRDIVSRKTAVDGEVSEPYERLYGNAEKLSKKKELIRMSLNDCTFHPKINSNTHKILSKKQLTPTNKQLTEAGEVVDYYEILPLPLKFKDGKTPRAKNIKKVAQEKNALADHDFNTNNVVTRKSLSQNFRSQNTERRRSEKSVEQILKKDKLRAPKIKKKRSKSRSKSQKIKKEKSIHFVEVGRKTKPGKDIGDEVAKKYTTQLRKNMERRNTEIMKKAFFKDLLPVN